MISRGPYCVSRPYFSSTLLHCELVISWDLLHDLPHLQSFMMKYLPKVMVIKLQMYFSEVSQSRSWRSVYFINISWYDFNENCHDLLPANMKSKTIFPLTSTTCVVEFAGGWPAQRTIPVDSKQSLQMVCVQLF